MGLAMTEPFCLLCRHKGWTRKELILLGKQRWNATAHGRAMALLHQGQVLWYIIHGGPAPGKCLGLGGAGHQLRHCCLGQDWKVSRDGEHSKTVNVLCLDWSLPPLSAPGQGWRSFYCSKGCPGQKDPPTPPWVREGLILQNAVPLLS